MAIPFNVPSDEQSESEWVVQFQMVLKRNILNLLNEVALIRDNTPAYPDRVPPDTSPQPNSRVRQTEFAPFPAASPQNIRSDLDWPSTQSTGNDRNNLNLRVLLSSTLNPMTIGTRGAVLAAAQAHAESTTRRCRRQRTTSESSCCQEETKSGPLTGDNEDAEIEPAHRDWFQVGAFLRQIADDFQADSLKDDDAELSRRPKERCKEESSSLFSKIMPASIKSSIWTAVICVIGWQLFRAR